MFRMLTLNLKCPHMPHFIAFRYKTMRAFCVYGIELLACVQSIPFFSRVRSTEKSMVWTQALTVVGPECGDQQAPYLVKAALVQAPYTNSVFFQLSLRFYVRTNEDHSIFLPKVYFILSEEFINQTASFFKKKSANNIVLLII